MKLFVIFLSIFIVWIRKSRAQDFGYDGEKGPQHWGEQYNTCSGKHQSPINIDSLDVKYVFMKPIQFAGFTEPPAATMLTNNGHTVMVTVDSEVTPTISGGPLHGTYEFAQLHFHWGDNDTFGSEDHIDSRSFPMELHMVFYKKLYRNTRSAMDYKDGLTVFAIFYDISEYDNPAYEEFSDLLDDVETPGSAVNFKNPPALQTLLPSDLVHYYTYNGSLTTPPCSEVVTWIEFKKPVYLSHKQIDKFRAIQNEEGHSLTHNFRPIQPLNDRVVLYNIAQHELDKSYSNNLPDDDNDDLELLDGTRSKDIINKNTISENEKNVNNNRLSDLSASTNHNNQNNNGDDIDRDADGKNFGTKSVYISTSILLFSSVVASLI